MSQGVPPVGDSTQTAVNVSAYEANSASDLPSISMSLTKELNAPLPGDDTSVAPPQLFLGRPEPQSAPLQPPWMQPAAARTFAGDNTQQWDGQHGPLGAMLDNAGPTSDTTLLWMKMQEQDERMKAQEKRYFLQEQQMNLIAQDLAGAREELAHARDKMSKRAHIVIDDHLLVLIHEKMRFLLGVHEKIRRTYDPLETPFWLLPEPLAPGSPPRMAPDGATRLHNPDWNASVCATVNYNFIEAAVSLILHTQSPLIDTKVHTPAVIRCAIKTYFRHLKKQHNICHLATDTPLPVARKQMKDRRHSRRKFRTFRARKANVVLRKYFSYKNTVGLSEITHTEWAPSELSTRGGVSDYEGRTRCRERQGVPHGQLEVRTRTWVNIQRQRLENMREVIEDLLPAVVIADTQPSLLSPTDDGVDYTYAERAQLESLMKQVANCDPEKRRQGTYRRFVGRPNSAIPSRTLAKAIIYKDYISPHWATLSESNKAFFDGAQKAPPTFTVFAIDVPDMFIKKEDRKRLAKEN
ncbi:hypothetical protein C8Q78DRAFT_1077970 [Trametes maxima]|nr:hypothetical protein C8Q78DRAFT_1077970 [Trametes maxima]